MKSSSSAARYHGAAPRATFITGTDTGVGKTLLTALLLVHLRAQGCRVLALKPFCSGERADAELLHDLEDGELTLDEVNPFYFSEPLAPLVAARRPRRKVSLHDVLKHIKRIAARLTDPSICQSINPSCFLLIEGVGGLLVPLGQDYSVLDLISGLTREFETPSSIQHPESGIRHPESSIPLEVVVVSTNRLGTINHTLLTVRAIQAIGIQRLKVALMDTSESDYSAHSNPGILAELLTPVPLVRVPFLGPNPLQLGGLKKKSKKMKKVLARILS